jgi:hypothetical protein
MLSPENRDINACTALAGLSLNYTRFRLIFPRNLAMSEMAEIRGWGQSELA